MVQQDNTFFFLSQMLKRKFSFHIWLYRELQVKKPHVKQWNLEKTAPVSWITVKASRCDNQGGVGKSGWVAPPGHWGPVQPRWAMANGPFQRLWRTPLPSPPVTGRGGGVPGPAAPAPPPPSAMIQPLEMETPQDFNSACLRDFSFRHQNLQKRVNARACVCVLECACMF